VHPREVFREAAAASAAAIVLFHNHPSGDPAPSPDDVALTARMVNAGAIMGIDVLDHVILADQRYFSFAESGQLPPGIAVRATADLAERAG
jgi:DNA repair protein RadC